MSKKLILRRVVLVTAMLLSRGAQAGTLGGTVVIANSSVRMSYISAEELKNLFTGKTTYWAGGQSVVIVVLADRTDGALEEVSGMDGSGFRTYWQRLVFSGRGQEPRKVDDVSGLVRLVSETRGAIALAPAGCAAAGVQVLEVK
jgi:ABC-type phosphate transport system substrate-binding protein